MQGVAVAWVFLQMYWRRLVHSQGILEARSGPCVCVCVSVWLCFTGMKGVGWESLCCVSTRRRWVAANSPLQTQFLEAMRAFHNDVHVRRCSRAPAAFASEQLITLQADV